jgi:amidase
MALTVAETAALLDVLAGTDTSTSVGSDVSGQRVGVPRDLWGTSPAADAAAERALALLSEAGVEIIDGIELPALKDFDDEQELILMLTELKVAIGRYLATRDCGVKTLLDVVAFNRTHAEQELPWFGQELFEKALETDGVDGSAYSKAVEACRVAGPSELDRVLTEHHLDALVAPTTSPATPIDLVNGDPSIFGCSGQSALAGAPILTVPLELAQGLPVAVSLWGARHHEVTLVLLGSALESGRDSSTGPLPAPTFPTWV